MLNKTEKQAKNLKVCDFCLMGIESKEGNQVTKKHYIDIEDTETKCDWCGEGGFDLLYEIL